MHVHAHGHIPHLQPYKLLYKSTCQLQSRLYNDDGPQQVLMVATNIAIAGIYVCYMLTCSYTHISYVVMCDMYQYKYYASSTSYFRLARTLGFLIYKIFSLHQIGLISSSYV